MQGVEVKGGLTANFGLGWYNGKMFTGQERENTLRVLLIHSKSKQIENWEIGDIPMDGVKSGFFDSKMTKYFVRFETANFKFYIRTHGLVLFHLFWSFITDIV